jgi:DNA recombination protein RmuC
MKGQAGWIFMDIALLVLAVSVVAAAAILGFALTRRQPQAEPTRPDPRLDTVISAQGAISAQFQQTVAAQNQLSQRIDALNQRLGESLKETTDKTAATLGSIGARLTVIDEAQKNIAALSGQVVSLQEILSNKQSRGAYGQAQMEEIVRDGLPANLYSFQSTLSNNSRPDCLIHLPGASGSIVIDSKFPLECFGLVRAATNDDERKVAMARVRSDVLKHVNDIAEKYLLPGETQTPAIMFVPSESIYAELHDGFSDVIQKAHRAQVIVVSPNILMLAINTIQTVMKDARMREQANLIQREVGVLLQDVRRLAERVEALRRHFGQSETDLKEIGTSIDKITKRASAIQEVELADAEKPKLTVVKEG